MSQIKTINNSNNNNNNNNNKIIIIKTNMLFSLNLQKIPLC